MRGGEEAERLVSHVPRASQTKLQSKGETIKEEEGLFGFPGIALSVKITLRWGETDVTRCTEKEDRERE